MSSVTHMPRPMTNNADEIAAGRWRALEQYRAARTDRERFEALVWVNHWRTLWEHAKLVRFAG